MFSMSLGLFVFVVPVILIITVVAFFIYKRCYDKHTNKVLEEGETKKRKWVAPWGFALIVLGVQLVIIAGIMFPVSMLMVDTSVHQDSNGAVEIPVGYGDGYDNEYYPDEIGYMLVDKVSKDNVSCKVYQKDNEDETITYYVSGTVSGEVKDKVCEIGYDEGSARNYFMATYIPEIASGKAYYFFMTITVNKNKNGVVKVEITESTYNDSAPHGAYPPTSEVYGLNIITELDIPLG